MKKYDIKLFFDFLVDLVDEFSVFKEDIYDARFYFSTSGCYELYKITKHYFPDCYCMVRNDLRHCAILCDNEMFDINGKIDDISDYRFVLDSEIEFLENGFKIIDDLKSNNIINEVNKCNIKGSLCE